MLKRSFQNKIIWPIVVVVVLLVVILNFYLSVKFLSYSDSLISEKILINVNTLKFHLDDSRDNSKTAAISMAFNPEAVKAVKERDTKKILHVFTSMVDLYRISYFTVCDNNGFVLARTYEPEIFGDSILNQQNVKDALNGKVSSYFESGTHVKISLRTGAPIYDTDGTLIGAISAGVRFDMDSEVDDMKKMLNSEVTIYYGNTRIATTIINDGQRIIGTSLDPYIEKIVIENKQEYLHDVDIFGTQYKTFYLPLINGNDKVFAAFAISTSIEELKEASNILIIDGIIIGAIGLSISVLFLFYIVSSISKPLVNLAIDMDNIADGNLKINTDIDSDDEIGRLSKSLQHVVSIINKLLEDINIMIHEQEKGNTSHSLSTDTLRGDYKILGEHILKLVNFGMYDQLTSMPNRRTFDNRLDLEWNRAIREMSSISILLMDVDKFKNYNDVYGHQQGDLALQTVAQVLMQSTKRAVDFAARWGGEEFAVLLPGTDVHGALKVAEQIRAEIENTVIPCTSAGATKITVSIGVNIQTPAQHDTLDSFISNADKALYKAKETGRNRVVCNEANNV
jgi:diguanylate cyclase (GGDEF)-like protein